MDTEVLKVYTEIRKDHVGFYAGSGALSHYKVTASQAIKSARYIVDTNRRWNEAEDAGLVRLDIEPDYIWDYEDLAGDCFNHEVNDNIQPHVLERQEQEFKNRIDTDGVWGIVGKYFDGQEWQTSDSCWGFVGDDWKDSGYDLDIMNATLDALASVKHCPCCGQPIN